MFYKNSINLKGIKYKNNKLKSFGPTNGDKDVNLLKIEESKITYNFDSSDGSLKDGFGIKTLRFRSEKFDKDFYKILDGTSDSSFIMGCWLLSSWSEEFQEHRTFLLLYSSYGDFYYNRLHGPLTTLTKIEGLKFQQKPIVASYNIDGVDSLILVSKKDGMYIWQHPDVVKKVDNVPSISSMCVHNNRLFVITHGDRRRVWFSDNTDPTKFNLTGDGAGYIELPDEGGRGNKVISFGEYLYVIRDFGIAKVVTEDPNNFVVQQLCICNSRIYENSVCICGDKILYLSADGIYEFNGNKTKKLGVNISNMIGPKDNSYSVAGFCDGKYYLACTLDYKGDELMMDVNEQYFDNNSLLKIDVNNNDIQIMRGYDVQDIFVINDDLKSEVCVLIKEPTQQSKIGVLDSSGNYFKDPISKVWKSKEFDFDLPNREKLLREITLETMQDIELIVNTENGKSLFNISGMDGYQTIRIMKKAKKFSLTIRSLKDNNYISNLQIMVGYL